MMKFLMLLLPWIQLNYLILTGMLTPVVLHTWPAIQVLLSYSSYDGPNKIFVGDGTELSISHAVRTVLLSSPLDTHLENVLVVS